ncbi:MAG: hypothetical protein ACJ8E1_07355, partial [Xanthobacteraceae bacterium]
LLEHDLCRKPVSTFRDHALTRGRRYRLGANTAPMLLFLNDRAAGETLAVHEFVNSLKCRMFLVGEPARSPD